MEQVVKEIQEAISSNISGDMRYGLRLALDIIRKNYTDVVDDRKVNTRIFKGGNHEYKLKK